VKLSEVFTRLKEPRILSRQEFEGLKTEAAKQGISFRELTRKQVKCAGSTLTVEVLYTFDGNPINAANTNIFVVSEEPLVDWKAKAQREIEEAVKAAKTEIATVTAKFGAARIKFIAKIKELEKQLEKKKSRRKKTQTF